MALPQPTIDASGLERWQRLSPSSIDDWEKCPRSWKIDRIDPGPPKPTHISALIGSYGHLVLEHLLAEDPERRTRQRAGQIAVEKWLPFSLNDDFQALALDERGESEFKHAVWRGIEGYFGLEDPRRVHLGDGSGLEVPLGAELGGAVVVGHADRVDVDALGDHIIDYKFGKAPRPEYEAPKRRQIRLYGAMLQASGRPLARRGTLMYVTEGVRISELLTQDKIDAAVGEVADVWGQIQTAIATDTFNPSPGPLCGWCPHVGSCGEGAAEVRIRARQGRLKPSAPARAVLGI